MAAHESQASNFPRRPRHCRLKFGALLAFLLTLLLGVPLAGPAHAILGSPIPVTDPEYSAATDIVITSTGAGQGVDGALPPLDTAWAITSYPTSIPPGYETNNASFAGIINTQSVGGGNTAQMYCIDVRTETRIGLGYVNGTWDEGNVPNVGYVNRILNTYYPLTNLPAGLNDNQRAAAVQTAIWFFTDGYVINPTDPLAAPVAAIANATIAAGPLTEPDPPAISITPPFAAAAVNGLAGPFAATSEGGATITLGVEPGYELFADAAGTLPVTNPVASGSQFWVRSGAGGTGPAGITARAVVPVQTGSVYLYDGATPDQAAAQKLILAVTRELSADADAAAGFYEVGSLTVTKSITGTAGGSQGDVLIDVDCGPGFQFTFTVPAGTTGDATQSFTGIPAGSICTITEPNDGATPSVVVTSVLPAPVTITANTTAAATVTDSYTFAPGSLLVRKTVAGSAAGSQGEVRIAVVCTVDGTPVLDETLIIPAGTIDPAVAEFAGLPAGTGCTITETADGSTATVLVTVAGEGNITIPAGGAVEAAVTNTYEFTKVKPAQFNSGTRRLPSTGTDDVGGLLTLGAVLLAAGGINVAAANRRRGRRN